jgi:hypothetical protein
MTHLLVVCKDCRHEVWMTPRDYIKWRCPHCNGYPAVREARREKTTESWHRQKAEMPDDINQSNMSEGPHPAAVQETVCYIAG